MSNTLELIREAKGGSSTAFNVLFQRHRGRLTALVAARMGPALRAVLEAEDLVQETYLQAARKFADFTPDAPQGFYRWLARIAGFKVKEAERARRAKKRGAPDALRTDPVSKETSVAGRAGRSERAAWIADAIAGLPAAQGRAVRLRYLQGLSLRETAARLDRSEAAVKALVGRGLQALAGRMTRSR